MALAVMYQVCMAQYLSLSVRRGRTFVLSRAVMRGCTRQHTHELVGQDVVVASNVLSMRNRCTRCSFIIAFAYLLQI